MTEFFKQLIAQLAAVWQRLSLSQKVITTSLVGFTFVALFTLIFWSHSTVSSSAGYKTLYSDLELEEISLITEKLNESGYKYKLEDDGRTILIETKSLYEARMVLAREGLPASRGIGYELFDKTNIGVTDFVQKLNARRAVEGELQRTIEGLGEIKMARVHIVIPEPSIFLEKQEEPKASIVIKTLPGKTLNKEQVRGISHLVSNSIQGLRPQNISIVDFDGRLLSNPYNDDETALASSRNMELQQNVERYLEHKANRLLGGVLGPGKATIQIAADLDFNRVERTMERYNPESRVIRSEERSDHNVKNAPDGDQQQERSLTNYEIDKTVEHIVSEIGNVKRLTISVAVDGRYRKNDEGVYEYEPRSTEEITNIEDIIKNAVGYDLARGDQIVVAQMQFDNEQLLRHQDALQQEERMQLIFTILKYSMAFLIAVLIIFILRSVAKTLAEAMNPPVPQVAIGAHEDDTPVDIPDEMRRSNELLERVEMMTHEEPVNIASIIKEWLREPVEKKKSKNNKRS